MSRELPVAEGSRVVLDKAEELLAKNEFAQAEKLARKGLASPFTAQAHCVIGTCCMRTGRNDEALTNFRDALVAAATASAPGLEARALNGIAVLERSDQERAIETAHRALVCAEQADDTAQQAKALNILGSLNTDSARYPEALEFYKRALVKAEASGDKQSIAAYLGNIGNVHRMRAEYSRALDYFARALAIAERMPDRVFIERNLHLIGEVHSALGDNVLALEFFGRALVLAEQLGNKINVTSLYISIGIVHSNLADYPRALDYYARALAIAEETGDKFSFAACLDNIGTIYWNLVDYPRALDYLSRALAVAEEIGAKTLIANNLGNTGIVYNDSGDHVRALEYLERAIGLSEEIGDRNQTGHWMHGIACARRKLGHREAAYQGFIDTLRHRREVLHTKEGVAESLLGLGGVLRELGNAEQGLVALQEALELAEESGEKKVVSIVHREIADAYSSRGDAAKAYEHFKRYHELDKEVFSEESQKRIELFHIRAAVAGKEHEAEVLRLRADRSERDLAMNTMQLLAQSEHLSRVRDDLFEIVRRLPVAGLAAIGSWEPTIRELKEKLKELPSKSVDWTTFEAQFTSVHPEFRATLMKKYPELTKQELKMCQLARLGIKTSEMALLLCLSERTIDSHRLNLRKKVGLNKDQSLSRFLAEIE